jgi:hypothetical protein
MFPLCYAINCTSAAISAELEQYPLLHNVDFIEESSSFEEGAVLARKMLLSLHIHMREIPCPNGHQHRM